MTYKARVAATKQAKAAKAKAAVDKVGTVQKVMEHNTTAPERKKSGTNLDGWTTDTNGQPVKVAASFGDNDPDYPPEN